MKVVIAVLVCAVLGTATAAAQTLPIRSVQNSERTAQIELKSLARSTAQLRTQTWLCQDSIGISRTRASASPWALPVSVPYRRWVVKLWKTRSASCVQQKALRATLDPSLLSNTELYQQSQREIARGGIYSYRWGDASPRLKSICYEMVRRAFAPYGTQEWARFIVNRESGCNPGAVNTTYSDPGQRATGIAQLIPDIHTWVDYGRYTHDMKYAVDVFLRLSHGGRTTGPWACC